MKIIISFNFMVENTVKEIYLTYVYKNDHFSLYRSWSFA